MKKWRVRFTGRSSSDLVRMVAFLAETEPRRAAEAREAIVNALAVLERLPFLAPPARLANRRSLRELVVPFGRTGYVVLLEVERGTVTVLRIRHQLEGDYR